MSKTDKIRGRLASIAKDREEFERQRKELEEQMHIGKQNYGKIKKGLKNNEIVDEPMVEIENDHHGHQNGTRKDAKRLSHPSPAGSAFGQMNGSSSGAPSPIVVHTLGLSVPNSPSVPTSNGFLVPISMASLMPSGTRISEWCFTGALDSSPPVVKSKELYESIRLLGRGAFGEVNLIKNVEDNKLYAIKTIFCSNDSKLQEGLREVTFLRRVRHPCIIDIHDGFITANPRILNIVMHYCESGNMSTVITAARKNNNSISESQIIKWLIQLALALNHIHENHIIHRDLKPMNIMLTDGGDMIKLADFGLAKNMTENEMKETTEEAGTPYYTAPEMIEGKSYSYPADCWSLGVVLYQLLGLERPFEGSSTALLVKAILDDEPTLLPAHYSEEIRATALELLIKNPQNRLNMVQLLTDPFFFTKVSSFPQSYRPKTLEERIRRQHIKQLEYQLDVLSQNRRLALQSDGSNVSAPPSSHGIALGGLTSPAAQSSILKRGRESLLKAAALNALNAEKVIEVTKGSLTTGSSNTNLVGMNAETNTKTATDASTTTSEADASSSESIAFSTESVVKVETSVEIGSNALTDRPVQTPKQAQESQIKSQAVRELLDDTNNLEESEANGLKNGAFGGSNDYSERLESLDLTEMRKNTEAIPDDLMMVLSEEVPRSSSKQQLGEHSPFLSSVRKRSSASDELLDPSTPGMNSHNNDFIELLHTDMTGIKVSRSFSYEQNENNLNQVDGIRQQSVLESIRKSSKSNFLDQLSELNEDHSTKSEKSALRIVVKEDTGESDGHSEVMSNGDEIDSTHNHRSRKGLKIEEAILNDIKLNQNSESVKNDDV